MTALVARTEVARSELRDLICDWVPADVLETVVDVMTTGPYLMLYNYYDGTTVNAKYLITDNSYDTTDYSKLLLSDWFSRHLPSLPLTELKWFSRFSGDESYEYLTGSDTLTVIGLSSLTGIVSNNFPALQSVHLQLFKPTDEVFDGVTELKMDCIDDLLLDSDILEDSDSIDGLFRMFPNLRTIISPFDMYNDALMVMINSIRLKGLDVVMEDISDFHGLFNEKDSDSDSEDEDEDDDEDEDTFTFNFLGGLSGDQSYANNHI